MHMVQGVSAALVKKQDFAGPTVSTAASAPVKGFTVNHGSTRMSVRGHVRTWCRASQPCHL